MKLFNGPAVGLFAFSLAAASAGASTLFDGGCVGAGVAACPGAVTIFSDSETLIAEKNASVSTANYQGSLLSAVYRNSGGTLDFLYQFVNSAASKDSIERITPNTFAGFGTDVGYRTGALGSFTAGSYAPLKVDRSVDGSVVGFNFSIFDAATRIQPGSASDILEIRTNARRYTEGEAGILDGIGATAAAFQPAGCTPLPGVPEPSTMVLLAGGLLSISFLKRPKV